MFRSTARAPFGLYGLKAVLGAGMVGILAALGGAPHASAGSGVVNSQDFLIWQRSFGAAATESAELAILNTCNKTIRLSWKALSGEPGADAAEARNEVVLRPKTSTVVPIPFPKSTSANGRRHVELIIEAEPTPCITARRKGLLLSMAVLNKDAKVLHFSDLPSNGELLPAAPEHEGMEVVRRGEPGPKLLRTGAEQELEVAVFNRCRGTVKFKLLTKNLGSSDDPVKQKVSLAAGDGSVMPLPAFDGYDGWIELNSVAQIASANACRRGRVDASASVYSSNGGGTAEISLLLPAIQAAREFAD